MTPVDAYSLLAALPDAAEEEAVDMLLQGPGFRLERIISNGQRSPDGFWYDQAEAEWVMLLAGDAKLLIEGEADARALKPGDAVFLPASRRHPVGATAAGQETVWLALFATEAESSPP